MEKHNIEWDTLYGIYQNYVNHESDLYSAAHLLNEKLKKAPGAHIVHFRTKNPIHLLDKVVRKKDEKDKVITKDNYLNEITDLIGIRILHLYKEDWLQINDYILNQWNPDEPPTANIREGDIRDIYEENDCEIKVHEAGYRSVHYHLVTKPFNEEYVAEVQVRTIFEEAWSEIDHDIRYPVHVDNPLINAFLMNFNRLAGSADEMSTYLKTLKSHIEENVEKHQLELKEKDREIESLKEEIEKLEIDQQDRDKITGLIDNIGQLKITGDENVYSFKGLDYPPTISQGSPLEGIKLDDSKIAVDSIINKPFHDTPITKSNAFLDGLTVGKTNNSKD